MILQPFEITQGNYGQQLPFTLLNGAGLPVNLTGASLALKVQDSQDSTGTLIPITGTMSVDDALNGICHYTVANGDFTYPGTFLAEVVVTFAGGPISFPGVRIIVQPSLPRSFN